MPVIYLKHPKHGTKVATQEQEAAYDEANGWERFTLEHKEPEEKQEEENVTELRTKRKYTRRA